MGYRYDMSKEKDKGVLLPEGWRRFKVTACEEKVSKSGNDMFVLTFMDCETRQSEEVYAIATQGKRWFLKSILSACGIEAAQDGIYEWDIPDILDQYVQGRVEHFEEEWIDRSGKSRTTKKGKIVEVKEDDGSGAPDIPDEGTFAAERQEKTPF
jgi:hypothetical protein